MNSPLAAPDRQVAERATRICLLAAFWLPLGVCTWLALSPSPPQPAGVSDVVLHGVAFSYLTFALGMAYPAAGMAALVGWMAAYGVFIEAVQSFEVSRSAELKDLLVDLLGIATGLVLLRLLAEFCRRLLRGVFATLLGSAGPG